MKFLICIITYKASFRVKEIIKEMPFDYLAKFNYKILFSDDSSNDNTIDHIIEIKNTNKNIIVNLNKKNLGYGGNIKKCLKYAYNKKFTHAIMVHGDNQYSSKYLKTMINNIILHKYTFVCGTRMKKKNSALKGNMPLYKFLGNIFLTKCFNILFGTNFTDCHTGYWAYNLKKINKNWFKDFNNGFLFDLDVRLKLTKNNLSIKEIPIKTRYGTERSSFHFKYALNFFIKIIFYKIFF